MTKWIESIAEAAANYDGFVVDQFGVLHDGVSAYPGAADALASLRAHGKHVLVLSNSGKRAAPNAARLARFGVGPDHYDELLTSGELTWQMLDRRDRAPWSGLGSRVLLLHPPDDRAMVEGLSLEAVTTPEEADFVLLASLAEDDTFEQMDRLLRVAADRRLPLVCANPDRQRLTRRGVVPSSGALAARYAALGASVIWVGKPHSLIYDACRERLQTLGARRICAIGDSLEHDIGGGARAGFETCLITGGLYRDEFARAGTAGRDEELARLLRAPEADGTAPPTWILPTLRW